MADDVNYQNWREIASGAVAVDYAAVGFKAGIEIHQQIDSHKLFCDCESVLRGDAPSGVVERKLHAVASEFGEFDAAALQAAAAGKKFFYEYYDDGTCLVELDEEPPHGVNRDALNVALQVALLLNASPVGEIQVMRKTVVDGSNTSGFQRTALVATKGGVETGEGKSVIEIVSLEEDAARIIAQTPQSVTYRLDRLGIPLIEVVTDPSLRSPRQALDTARLIGDVLRSTKVKRGLGTIRQDVSVSVTGGTRIEAKGVQTLELIPVIVENEARRQIALVGIAAELNKKLVSMPASEIEKNAGYAIKPNGVTEASLKLPGGVGFAALLKEKIISQRSFEQEFLDRCRVKAPQAKVRFDYSSGDAVFTATGARQAVEAAVRAAAERYAEAFEGVPRETRRALENGETEYMRPLAGAARMYPETDVPHLKLDVEFIARLKATLPELRSKTIDRMKVQYSLERGEATEIMDAGYAAAFESAVRLGLNAKLVSNELLAYLRSTPEEKRSRLDEKELLYCFKALKEGSVPRESIQACLTEAANVGAAQAIRKISAGGAAAGEVDAVIIKIVKANPGKGFQALMGDVMRELRGKASGTEIAVKLRKALGQ